MKKKTRPRQNTFIFFRSVREKKKYPSTPNAKIKTETLQTQTPQSCYSIPLNELTYKEDSLDNVIYGEDGSIECASLNRLIIELTTPENYDTKFMHTFMTTFRMFVEGTELIRLIGERWNYPPPVDCTGLEFQQFKLKTLVKIRLRILQVLKYWILNFYQYDFDAPLKGSFNKLLKMMEKSNEKSYARVLRNTLKKKEKSLKLGENSNGAIEFESVNRPKMQMPRSGVFSWKKVDKHNIFLWPPLEIARQITLVESAIFRKIQPKECLNQNWNKSTRAKTAPNISKLINWFNKLSGWVGTIIVQEFELEKRVRVMSWFIAIAEKLSILNNFNALFSILSGLSLAAIYRLKKTWEILSKKDLELWDKMSGFISRDKNFCTIRSTIRARNPPLLPYIGLYLTDLTFIEEGGRRLRSELVNFVKCRCFANVLQDLQIYQNSRYEFIESKTLKDILLNLPNLPEEEMYQLSLRIEPRRKKKRKRPPKLSKNT